MTTAIYMTTIMLTTTPTSTITLVMMLGRDIHVRLTRNVPTLTIAAQLTTTKPQYTQRVMIE